MKFQTKLIHHPGSICPHTGAVSVPIYQVSTFRQQGVGRNQGYEYSRSGNPTREVLEGYIASLEQGERGYAFSSGMAAISASLMLLKGGEHVIVTEELYGGTHRVLTGLLQDYGLSFSFVDTSDLERVEDAFQDNTRAVFLETPSNPLMRISDLKAVSELALARGAIVIVDNTFMTPLFQNPLTLGADVVVHSATKYLGGHSDLIMGLVVTSDARLASRIRFTQNAMGGVPSPFDCWLLIRGMKTLDVRVCRAQENAQRVAEWLDQHPLVEEVNYPGLDSFPQKEDHFRQAEGGGAMLSFRLSPEIPSRYFLENLPIWSLAVSLGAVESIVTLPARMTHLSYAEEERRRLGIDDQLVRLSVGIESADDLIEALSRGIEGGRP